MRTYQLNGYVSLPQKIPLTFSGMVGDTNVTVKPFFLVTVKLGVH